MRWEDNTASNDYLSISFEGMKEARKKIISSIDAKKAQRENISKAIESLQVPDSILRGYGNDLILIKNSISKDIDELMRMSSHVDYVMKRFEEVDNEYATRFKSVSYGIQEKLGLQRENGIFGCGIAGLTPIASQVTKPFSGVNNKLEKKAAQLTFSSLNNKNTGKSLLLTGNGNITAQAKKMYLSQESGDITDYSVNKATKGEDSKIKVFSESELKSLADNLNNSNIPFDVKERIKNYIIDSGAMYFIDPKTGDYVVRNKESDGTVHGLACTTSGAHRGGLTQVQMEANAKYIYDYLTQEGWSREAICALLGNMQWESGSINPGAWQHWHEADAGDGYGLVQWTPAGNKILKWMGFSKSNRADKADEMAKNDSKQLMDKQLEFLLINLNLKGSKEEKKNYGGEWIPTTKYSSPYKMTVSEFIKSDNDVEELAMVFHGSFERSGDAPGSDALKKRKEYANDWYDFFS